MIMVCQNSRRRFIKRAALLSISALVLPESFASGENEESFSGGTDENGLVFLFQGDSITDGNRGRNLNDLNHVMGHGYAFSIASRLGERYPEKKLSFYNRGISGNKVNDLAARWDKDTLDIKPDVLSILVGVNDSASVVFQRDPVISVEKYEEMYNSLLEQTKLKFPNILFVLCESFILPVGKVKDNFEAYTADMVRRQQVVKNLAIKHNAVFVGLQDIFVTACKRAPAEYWMWDGVHPTVAGHELITKEWMKQVGKRLKFIRKCC
jgi:lysophospholipase L1-like esterase